MDVDQKDQVDDQDVDQNESQVEDQLENHDDTISDMRHVFAVQLYDALDRAILESVPPGTNPDVPTIVQCLGLTAARVAASGGISELEFRRVMAIYCTQIREAFGLEVLTDGKPDKPSSILLV